ncbi:sensor histidine kinase [Cohnella suwonensis]|uniref:histidine kinase n=1 Tax=Cohnella suwonensis TaxID=696072 RepID=A0ABW0LRR5_9BACL
MLFVWIALWSVGLILLLADPRSSVNRWLSAVALFGGAGALAATLDNVIVPYIHEHRQSREMEQILFRAQGIASLSSYYGLPYAFMMFAMAYRPIIASSRVRRFASLTLLLPVAGFLIFTPSYNENSPITFTAVVWWAVPCILAGTAIILLGRSSGGDLSRAHWLIVFAVLPPVLFTMAMSYVLQAMGWLGMWRYNVWFVGIGVGVFLIGLFTYGFLGIRVLIDRRRLDSTLRAVTSGTSILHHAIKNDIGKMRLFTDKMAAYAVKSGQDELLEDIRVVQNASRHIQEMIARVHRRTEDLIVRPEEIELGALVRATLKPFEPRLGNIRLQTTVAEGWVCRLDPAQVGEALGNLIGNALEAMNGEGRLFVTVRESKRELTVEVRDTGPGMDRTQTAKALEPFYTTKGGKETSFGLGLPYAYYVMRKHGGSLRIRGKVGVGTRVYLTFPKRSVKAVRLGENRYAEGGVGAHG